MPQSAAEKKEKWSRTQWVFDPFSHRGGLWPSLTGGKQQFPKWVKPKGKLPSSSSILSVALGPAGGKAKLKATSFWKTLPPPPDLRLSLKKASSNLSTSRTGGGKVVLLCDSIKTHGWVEVLSSPTASLHDGNPRGPDQTKDPEQQGLCPTHFWPLGASPSGSPWEFRKC